MDSLAPHSQPPFPDPPGAESLLGPDDYDRALRQMKRHLTLLQLRRALLDPGLDARGVQALTDHILALQRPGV